MQFIRYGCILLGWLYTAASFAALLLLQPSMPIKALIEKGKAGDTFLFQSGKYVLEEAIQVPSGVILQGEVGTLLQQKRKEEKAFFIVANTKNATITHLSFRLDAGQKGILAHEEGTKTSHLTLTHLRFRGNLDKALSSKKEASRVAIYIRDADHVLVEDVEVTLTRGGIYVMGEDIIIKNNKLSQVHFGNIYVAGSHIAIIDNQVLESGRPTDVERMQGDAITIGESKDVVIKNNQLRMGFCYMLWAVSTVKNLSILNNTIQSGVTTGIMIHQGEEIIIKNNALLSNAAYGIAIMAGRGVAIENNTFDNNALYIAEGVQDAIVQENQFQKLSLWEAKLRMGSAVQSLHNQVEYANESAKPSLRVETASGREVRMGDVVPMYTNLEQSMLFYIKNEGELPLKFTGRPLIQLAERILPLEEAYRNVKGLSGALDFAVSAQDQPHKTSLTWYDSTSFRVQFHASSPHYGEKVVVNIFSTHPSYRPFWFAIEVA